MTLWKDKRMTTVSSLFRRCLFLDTSKIDNSIKSGGRHDEVGSIPAAIDESPLDQDSI